MSHKPHSIISLTELESDQQATAILVSYLFLGKVGMRLFSVACLALVLLGLSR